MSSKGIRLISLTKASASFSSVRSSSMVPFSIIRHAWNDRREMNRPAERPVAIHDGFRSTPQDIQGLIFCIKIRKSPRGKIPFIELTFLIIQGWERKDHNSRHSSSHYLL